MITRHANRTIRHSCSNITSAGNCSHHCTRNIRSSSVIVPLRTTIAPSLTLRQEYNAYSSIIFNANKGLQRDSKFTSEGGTSRRSISWSVSTSQSQYRNYHNKANDTSTTNSIDADDSMYDRSYLVQHFISLVMNGDVSNDEHQLEALTKLDLVRNHILHERSNFYTKSFQKQSHNRNNNSSSSSSLGDYEEMEATGIFPSYFRNAFNNIFTSPNNRNDNSIDSDNSSKGVYLHGGVGCGKTFCMNLFYDSLPDDISKQKVHFHSFMLNVHKQMHEAKMVDKIQGDPIPHIIHKIIQNGLIICFDEFQVTDVADALLLRRLFTGLFIKGAIIIATSNRPPSDLYLNGIQRDLFLPFIDLLVGKTHVVSMWESDVDYRLIQGENKARGVYFIGEESKVDFEKAFGKLTKTNGSDAGTSDDDNGSRSMNIIASTTLTTQGRLVKVPKACVQYGVARFTFNDLCRQARGAADYLLIGQHFHTVFVEDVPLLTMNDVNLVRRFIIFVDSMYECHVKLIIHAAASPTDIFKVDLENQFCDEAFAFDRTRSRLEEMGSDEYLKKRWVRSKTNNVIKE